MGAALTMLLAQAVCAKEDMRPLLPILKAEEIAPFCVQGLATLKAEVGRLEALPPAQSGEVRKVLSEWNALQIMLADLGAPIAIGQNMSPDPKVRANSESCSTELGKFTTALYTNTSLFVRLNAIKPVDAVDIRMQKKLLEGFEDNGIALTPEKRARLKQISERLDLIVQEFERNIRDNTEKVRFSAQEMKGLPESYLKRVKPDEQGNYLLGFSSPEFLPFIENADSSEARKRYVIAYWNRGTARNIELIQEASQLRLEIARLFELPSYAHFATRHRMARNPDNVYRFLDEVRNSVTELEKQELLELRTFKAQAEGTPLAETSLNRWDVAYWDTKLKRARYDFDSNALRKHFPTDAAVAWALHISEKLYGIEIKRVKVPVWHEDVSYYDVYDQATGRRISGFYLDLFPREGKYGHAAAWPSRQSSTLAERTPFSVLVTNFDRNGLNGDEMRTLVHEFGHVLHGVLSDTRYAALAGTAVERDFVEAPSQMYQEWTREKEPLALLPQFCKTPCPPMDDAMLARWKAARNFGQARRYAGQLIQASYDMALYSGSPLAPMESWKALQAASPLGYVEGTYFISAFSHPMRGYSAGYYGYMWSEVIALDMLSVFKGKLMDPAVGKRYRDVILARGGERPADEMVRDFLGRAPDSKAFFREITGSN